MKIFILRHGQAQTQITTDEVRPLTDKGKSDTDQMLRLSQSVMTDVKLILTSPLVRAQQTAEICAKFFPQIRLQTESSLKPESRPQEVYDLLEALRVSCGLDRQSVLLVSHQPLVGNLINELCGAGSNRYEMDTSSLAAIELDTVAPGMGVLRWLRHI